MATTFERLKQILRDTVHPAITLIIDGKVEEKGKVWSPEFTESDPIVKAIDFLIEEQEKENQP